MDGDNPDLSPAAFVPSTNGMTAHGLPTEKATALGNLAENAGPIDGVSQTSTAPPTSVLVALAAAGRNPTDILIPTQAGTEGSGGEEDDSVLAGGASESISTASEAAPMAGEGNGSHEEKSSSDLEPVVTGPSPEGWVNHPGATMPPGPGLYDGYGWEVLKTGWGELKSVGNTIVSLATTNPCAAAPPSSP